MKLRSRQNQSEQGSIIVSVLVVTLFLTTIIYALIVLANANLVRVRSRILLLQAQYSAESGADAALAILNNNNASYTGTTSDVQVQTNSLYKSTYATAVTAGASGKEKIITAIGKIYAPASSSTPKFTRTIEVTAQQSSTTTSSSILSRNILDIAASVKDIQAKDLYINGYINLEKNTNNLIAENITVADKNTGATNCSLGGPGGLTKPSSFSAPGQTKTSITVAYNNCISPPGNTTNANFTVAANQTNITKISSTYIPWSYAMDNTYQNSPSGCSDWTTGSSPRNIPGTGNTKKTHYPDSSGNISSSCGTSGDLSLGSLQYNIKNNAHIRANLCSATPCSPTFYNPDSGSANTKFIFVEGTVDFDTVTTASGSGPIVLVVYGSDPASLSGSCPYGGAFHLGTGQTNAPQLYVLASNGVCLDKSKFSVEPAFGGFSGKNLYIATNSGSPHDLHLDLTFPTSVIPVDLSWRAVRYRRI